MTSVYNKLEKQRRNLIRIGEKLSDSKLENVPLNKKEGI